MRPGGEGASTHAEGASTHAEVVEHVVNPTYTPSGNTEPLLLEHEDEVPAEDSPRTQTPNTPTPRNTPNIYETPGTAGGHLGGIYDKVREQNDRLAALGIIRTDDSRYLPATSRLDGSPCFVEVVPAARLRRREGEARPRLLRFMSIWLQEEIDAPAIAVKFNVSQQKVASMMASARRSPRAYGEFIASGAHDGQIPPWIMRPGGEIDAPSGAAAVPTVVPPVSPIPTEEPPAPERGGKMVVEDLPPPSPLIVQPPPTVETAQSPPVPRGNRLGTLYDNLRTDNYCLAEKYCGVFEGEDENARAHCALRFQRDQAQFKVLGQYCARTNC